MKQSWHTCEGVMAHSKTCAVGSCDIHPSVRSDIYVSRIRTSMCHELTYMDRSVRSSDMGSFDIHRECDLVILIVGSGIF